MNIVENKIILDVPFALYGGGGSLKYLWCYDFINNKFWIVSKICYNDFKLY